MLYALGQQPGQSVHVEVFNYRPGAEVKGSPVVEVRTEGELGVLAAVVSLVEQPDAH